MVLSYDPLEDGRVDDNTIDNILLLYHMKHTASMLPWICTVIDHRKCQTVARTSISGHAFSAAPCVPLFSSSRILIKHWTVWHWYTNMTWHWYTNMTWRLIPSNSFDFILSRRGSWRSQFIGKSTSIYNTWYSLPSATFIILFSGSLFIKESVSYKWERLDCTCVIISTNSLFNSLACPHY